MLIRGRLWVVSTLRAQSSRTGYSPQWIFSPPRWCQLQPMSFLCIVQALARRSNWRKHLERAVYPLQRGIRSKSREKHQEKSSCRCLRRVSNRRGRGARLGAKKEVLCFPFWETSLREASSTLGILPVASWCTTSLVHEPGACEWTTKAWRVPRHLASTPVDSWTTHPYPSQHSQQTTSRTSQPPLDVL